MDTAEFERLIGEGAFLEHAKVFDNYYGTGVKSVQLLQEQGFDVILEIDVQGAEQVRRALPDAISIFILPPSYYNCMVFYISHFYLICEKPSH